MSHIINRLELELNCADEEQAFNIRYNFAITLQDKITTAIDDVCSKYIRESEWIRIDKLELDLGWFNAHSFELEFGEIFQKKFETEILRFVSQLSIPEKIESRQRSRLALFKHFIQYGTLPWWADSESTDINEIAHDLWEKEEEALKDFFYQHRFDVAFWQRAAFQLNHQNKMLLTASFAELQHGIDLFEKWIKETTNLSGGGILFDSEAVLKTCIDAMLKNAASVFRTYPAINEVSTIFDQIMRLFFPAESVYTDKLIKRIKLHTTEKDKDVIKNPTVEPSQNREIKAAPPGLFRGRPSSDDPPPSDEKLLVKHAGIILLGAFLNPFFTNLELLDGPYWKNKETQYRAVHLLKFLSTGKQQNPEFNLNVEKIICGLSPEESLPVDIVLTADETNEAQSLLESVIEHWKVLKNTSVNGLRESFLKRDGLLKKREMDWLLQVERKTLDVLIDSIPWGFSTLKFPWTEQKLLVEW